MGLGQQGCPPADLDQAALDLVQRATRGGALSKEIGGQAYTVQIDLGHPETYAPPSTRWRRPAR
jgi:hypothetical protein